MPLLIALLIFAVMCVLMIVFMSKSSAPSPIDTAEAFCDAIIRNDKKTLEAISIVKSIPAKVIEVFQSKEYANRQVGQRYDFKIIEDNVSNDSWYYVIELKLSETNSKIEIKLAKSINRWVISNISLVSKDEAEL